MDDHTRGPSATERRVPSASSDHVARPRVRELRPDTFGPSPVDARLVEVMREHLTPAQIGKILRMFNDFSSGVHAMEALGGEHPFHSLLQLWEDDHKRKIDAADWPTVVKTHFVSVIVGHKRRFLKRELWRQDGGRRGRLHRPARIT